MKLGEKDTFTGIVRRARLDVGTPNERDGHVLEIPNQPLLELKLKLGNSFHAFTELFRILEGLVDHRVTVTGVPGSGLAAIFIDDLKDIKDTTPAPRRPTRPAGPKH